MQGVAAVAFGGELCAEEFVARAEGGAVFQRHEGACCRAGGEGAIAVGGLGKAAGRVEAADGFRGARRREDVWVAVGVDREAAAAAARLGAVAGTWHCAGAFDDF